MNLITKYKKDVFIKCFFLWILVLLLIAVTIATENNVAKRYILPESIIPRRYKIELQPFIFPSNFTFRGSVNIRVRCTENTNEIILNIYDITVREETVMIKDKRSAVNVRRINYHAGRQLMIIELQNRLSAGKLYTISMEFKGNLNRGPVGFFVSSYQTSMGETRWVAATHFQPTDARRAFPCFDEPAMKARFDIILIKPKNMTALSNMPVKRIEQRDEFWEAVIFKRTVPMSTYLVAFVICDYNYIQSGKIKVWTREDALDNVQFALETSSSLLNYFEEYFQIPYPLPKLDMVTMRNFPAAMENWGLMIYHEYSLLYDPHKSSSRSKQHVSTVVAHELAHQWYGNLVTPKSWRDIWLNEGFSSFMSYIGVEHEFPEWQMRLQYITDILHNVLKADSLKNSHPVSLPSKITTMFDMISYKKGASIVMMMNHFLGEETFRNGITAQINTPGNMRVDVKEVMDSWTLQTGYPLITVIRDYSSGNADIFQSRYLTDAYVNESYYWHIPITFTNAQELNWNPNVKMWLHKTNGTINNLPSLNEWIILNIQQGGYYRVNYDERNWGLLSSQLQQDHEKIHIINRAQILDDALDFAKANVIDYSIALDMTLYLHIEEEYTPWITVLNNIMFIETKIKKTVAFENWKTYFISKMQNIYGSLGWRENCGENILKQYLRILILTWMCFYEYQSCVDEAVSMYRALMNDSSNLIPSNLQGIVYRTAIIHGSVNEWEFAWNRFMESTSQTEKAALLIAMAHTKNPQLLYRYLNSTTSGSTIHFWDVILIFSELAANPYGYGIAFDYLRENWNSLFSLYSKTGVFNIFQAIATGTITTADLAKLETLYETHKSELGSSLSNFKEAVEEARANVLWITRNINEIKTWLDLH